MSLNKQAFYRYKILDSCLSNPYRKYTLSDLQERVWDDTKEIYPSRRTIQYDLQFLDAYNEMKCMRGNSIGTETLMPLCSIAPCCRMR